MKTIKDFREIYNPVNAKKDGEQPYPQNPVQKHADRNGNGDEVFKASKVKIADRHKTDAPYGYDDGEDETAYLKGNTDDRKLKRMSMEEVTPEDLINEISHETRQKWVGATWKKHLPHYTDKENGHGEGRDKPKMTEPRKKVFIAQSDKLDKEFIKRTEDKKKKEIENHTPQVHDLRHMSHDDVYDHTQTNEKIKNGDVMHVKGGVAAMIDAWPTMIHGKSDTLHSFKKGVDLHTIDDGIYHKSAKLADKLHGIKEEFENHELQNREPQVHDLRHMSHEDVYDHSQNNKKIKDGDVIHVKGGVAAMLGEWPAMIHGKSDTLHSFKKSFNLHTADNGMYQKTAKLADKLHGIKEESEINELSKPTLVKYITKAADSADTNAYNAGRESGTAKMVDKSYDTKDKRNSGIKLAAKKLSEGNKENKLKKNVFVAKLGGKILPDKQTKTNIAKDLYSQLVADQQGSSKAYAQKQIAGQFKRAGRAMLKTEEVIDSVFDKYISSKVIKEDIETVFERNLEGLSAKTYTRLIELFNTLDEENQELMITLTETREGINELIDFTISGDNI